MKRLPTDLGARITIMFQDWKIKNEPVTIAKVHQHIKKIKWSYMKEHSGFKIETDDLMKYCYRKHASMYLKSNVSERLMFEKLRKYKETRRKAGVIVLTCDLRLLLVCANGILCLPKGKEEYTDKDIKETAYRELKEETKLAIRYDDFSKNDRTIIQKINKKKVVLFIEESVESEYIDLNHTVENEVDEVVLVPLNDLIDKIIVDVVHKNEPERRYSEKYRVSKHVQKLIHTIRRNIDKFDSLFLNRNGSFQNKYEYYGKQKRLAWKLEMDRLMKKFN